MQEYLASYQRAIKNAIQANHALGLPVYQCKDGYIIAIYPGGREVKLEKAQQDIPDDNS